MVPMDAATARRPVTASSRPTITTTIHASILSTERSDARAAATKSLSAIGSSSVPSVVTWLRRRASIPSAQSVMEARMKMAAAITACTREDEMRNTIRSGTATIRVRVRPIGKFTLELRCRDESATSLSEVAHDLVNVRHVPGHERRRVKAQARVDVGAPTGRDEAARPRRVPLETAYVVDIAPTRVQRVASSVAEHGGHGGGDAGVHGTRAPGDPAMDGAPGEPAQRMATARRAPAAHAAAALTLTSAATPMAAAARAARSARVPLLVVKKTVLPRTPTVPNSTGELLRSNPGIGSPWRSPATRAPSPHPSPARRRASPRAATGTIAWQPCAGAGMVVGGARGATDTAPGAAAGGAGATGAEGVRDNRFGGRRDVDPHGSGVLVPERPDLETQGVQVDETLGVALPIDGVGLERSEVRPVEGPRRPAAGDRDTALVQLEPRG